MKSLKMLFLSLVCTILLQSCFIWAGYALYRTIKDINGILTTVSGSIQKVRTILDQGKEIKQAAEEGKLISSLAEKIPSLVKSQVEPEIHEKIQTLSGNLKGAADDLTQKSLTEDLDGANSAYNNIVKSYNDFVGFSKEMAQKKTS